MLFRSSIAAEAGVIGLLLFLWLLVFLARSLKLDTTAGAAGAGALAFFVLLSLTHDPLFQAPFSMALALALGASLPPVVTPARAGRPPAFDGRSRPS